MTSFEYCTLFPFIQEIEQVNNHHASLMILDPKQRRKEETHGGNYTKPFGRGHMAYGGNPGSGPLCGNCGRGECVGGTPLHFSEIAKAM